MAKAVGSIRKFLLSVRPKLCINSYGV